METNPPYLENIAPRLENADPWLEPMPCTFALSLVRFDDFFTVETRAQSIPDFLLAPNPTGDAVYLSWTADISTPVHLTIFDAQGRPVWAQQTASTVRSLRVEVSDWPTGVYLVALSTKEKITTKRLFVVD